MFARIPLVLSLATAAAALNLDAAVPYSLAPGQNGYGPAGSAPTPIAPYDPNAIAHDKAPPKTLTRTVYRNPAAATASPSPGSNKANATSANTGSCKNVQNHNVKEDQQKAEAIKEAFIHGWNAYIKYANGYDELRPLTLNGSNSRYGWGLTIIDSISTAIIMGLTDIVGQMLDFVGEVDFTRTDFPDETGGVQIFETNIRYIGGLISAYDLLTSGQFQNTYGDDKVETLLDQAVALANKVAYGFNTASGLPAVSVNFDTNEPIEGKYTDRASNQTFNSTNTASIGTFVLEWGRLSDLTGNQTYREIAERANQYLVEPSPSPKLPGLVGTQFDVDTGNMITVNGGWQAGVDSFLEYLIKYYQYDPTGTAEEYKDFWLDATKSTIDHLAVHPRGFPNITYISRLNSNGTIDYIADDFSCFAGGNWLLGGALLDRPEITKLGVDWTYGCYHLYDITTTGLGPLAWGWFDDSGKAFDKQSEQDTAAISSAKDRGYFIPAGLENWFSRPEPIESLFYAYRITGEQKWADYAWLNFQAINTTARTVNAFAAVNNVDAAYGGSMSDNLDSFFFAEVLKYLYLTYTDPSVIDLSNWVFNTEAHPFQARCAEGDTSKNARTAQAHSKQPAKGSKHKRHHH